MWATSLCSASSGYYMEFHEGCYQKHTNLLNCRTSSLDISGYHADFHEGHDTVGKWQGCGMARERHEKIDTVSDVTHPTCSRNNQHYALICTTPLFYILAATCFSSSLPSSRSFLDPSELVACLFFDCSCIHWMNSWIWTFLKTTKAEVEVEVWLKLVNKK
jgi:hypothetical protein